MYLAELHGKLSRNNENKEDILTSNVFSFFKYVDRSVFLYTLLQERGIAITAEEALEAEFIFWPTFDDYTEPDIVIIVGSYYLLIEVKYSSGFSLETATSKHQLEREFAAGQSEAQSLGKHFRLLTVTADYSWPTQKFAGLPNTVLSDLLWMNWHEIALLIFRVLESGFILPPETRLFAEDLYKLLQRKNLRYYIGPAALAQHAMLTSLPEELFLNDVQGKKPSGFLGFLAAGNFTTPILKFNGAVFFQRSLNKEPHG